MPSSMQKRMISASLRSKEETVDALRMQRLTHNGVYSIAEREIALAKILRSCSASCDRTIKKVKTVQ